MGKVYHSSKKTGGRDDWGTPPQLFMKIALEFPITCDLAASGYNALCPIYVNEREDALTTDWSKVIATGSYGFCNPPYSLTAKFLERAAYWQKQKVYSVFLVAARPCTRYWAEHVHMKAYPLFIQGRIKFVGAKDPAPFESCLLVYGPIGNPYWYNVRSYTQETLGYEKKEKKPAGCNTTEHPSA